MKCSNCDGKGTVLKIIYEDWQKDKIVRSAVKCPRCNGSGEVPMTNEEWFTSLSTEEKATFLAIQVRLGVEFYRTDDERYQNYDWWIKWLKEKYNG